MKLWVRCTGFLLSLVIALLSIYLTIELTMNIFGWEKTLVSIISTSVFAIIIIVGYIIFFVKGGIGE